MTPLLALVTAVLALGAGPLLALAIRQFEGLESALYGFVIITVGILVLGGVMPAAIEHAGPNAILALVAGLAFPLLVERIAKATHRDGSRFGLFVALVGLFMHVAFDGIALGSADQDHGLLAAIVGHRLPVGLAVWMFVCPRFGNRWAAAVVVGLAAGTVLGFVLGQSLLTSGQMLHWIQAFVAGTLLHVLSHRPSDPPEGSPASQRSDRLALVGVAVGALFLLLLPQHEHSDGSTNVLQAFMQTAALLSLPLALGLTLSVGLLWLRPSRRVPFDEEGGGADGAVVGLALFGHLVVIAWILAAYAQLRLRPDTPSKVSVRDAAWNIVDARAPWVVFGIMLLALTPNAPSTLPPQAGLLIAVALGVVLKVPGLAAVFFALVLGRLCGSAAVAFVSLMLLPVQLRGRRIALHLIFTVIGTVLFWVKEVQLNSLALDGLLVPVELGAAVVGALVLASLIHQGPVRFAERLSGDDAAV